MDKEIKKKRSEMRKKKKELRKSPNFFIPNKKVETRSRGFSVKWDEL